MLAAYCVAMLPSIRSQPIIQARQTELQEMEAPTLDRVGMDAYHPADSLPPFLDPHFSSRICGSHH